MRFDRGLRSAIMKPYPTGYTAPSTEGFNTENPRCQFGAMGDGGRWLDEEDLPSVLELEASLIPVWVEEGSVLIWLDENNPRPLYGAGNILARVNMEYTGAGFYQLASGTRRIPFVGTMLAGYRLVLSTPYLYEKLFLVQSKSIKWATRWEKGPGNTEFLVSPLWALGAHQQDKDILPLVFSMESVREETQVQTYTLSSLQEQGITPPHPGWAENRKIIFADEFTPDQTRSFKESIQAGMACISLHLGADDNGNSLGIPYVSYRFENGCIFYRRRIEK